MDIPPAEFAWLLDLHNAGYEIRFRDSYIDTEHKFMTLTAVATKKKE